MDVLFCDIDGVLRTNQSDLWWSQKLNAPIPDRVFDRKFNPKSVSNLNYAYNLLRFSIVVSSTWRTQFTVEELRDIFKSNGISAPVIDKTETLNGRGEEIQEWLDRHSVKKFAVLDDNIQDIKKYIKPDNIIRCDVSLGFEDDRLVDRLIDILA